MVIGVRLKSSVLWAAFFMMCLTCMRSYAVEFFEPLAYGEAGSWVSPGVSPDDVCRRYAKLWRWDQNGYSAKIEKVAPGLWGCQRYYLGVRQQSEVTHIRGLCQTNPDRNVTGRSWSHPKYDPYKSALCSCPKVFDYRAQWCEGGKILNASPPKHLGNPSPKGSSPSVCQGNPINIAIGNKFQSSVEYSVPQHPFEFDLFYNGYDGRWRHGFSAKIYVESDVLHLIHFDGRNELFEVAGDYAKSEHRSGSFFRRVEDGWVYYTPDSIVEFGADGRPIKVKYLRGAEIKIIYSEDYIIFVGHPSGQLELRTDSIGQPIEFKFQSEKLLYKYDELGRLTHVIDSRQGEQATRQYHYEGQSLRLIGISDGLDERYATWAYDDQGRAISSEHAGGVDRVEITYNDDGSSTVTNELGKKATYRFQTIQGIKRITAIEGEPSPNCPYSNSTFTYDDRGLLKTKTDNKGIVTTYDYNDRGLEVTRVEASGTAQARTVTTEWHPSLYLPLAVIEPDRVTRYQYDDQGRQLSRTIENR